MADGPQVKPVENRIVTLDVLRGFALLGILVPNIMSFALPGTAMSLGAPGINDAIAAAGLEPNVQANTFAADLTGMAFHGKFMMLFSMLFGAGVVMYGRKFDRESKLRVGAGLWYSRCAWLLALGLLHAVGLWYGDILVWYAVAGMTIVWWCRRLRPALLLGMGVSLHLLTTLLMAGLYGLIYLGLQSGETDVNTMLGDPMTEIEGYRGGYLSVLLTRLPTVVFMYLLLVPIMIPGIVGLMLAGIGLTRLGVLTGERSTRFYLALAGVGIVGGGVITATVYLGITRAESLPVSAFLWMCIGQFVGIPLGLGYAGAVCLITKLNWSWITQPLASVGRMALTNYLMQTVLCTTLFYGYGLGNFARVQYPALFGIVVAVWGVNILFSSLWLTRFRMGPAEWMWRTLTYLKPPRIVKRSA